MILENKQPNKDELEKILEKDPGLERAILDFHNCGEEELASFFEKMQSVKSGVNLSQEAFLEMLNGLENKSAERELSAAYLEESKNPLASFRTRLMMKRFFRVAVPFAIAAIAAFVIIFNPFSREASQVSELKDISQEESAVLHSDSDLFSFLSEEKELSDVDTTLSEMSQSNPDDVFGLAAISGESNSVGFDSELSSFLQEENNLKEVDATLASF